MSGDLSKIPSDRLPSALQDCRETISSALDALSRRPDMEAAIRDLMRSHDAMETFCERSLREPDMMRLVLMAGISALVNVRSVQSIEAELKRRAADGN